MDPTEYNEEGAGGLDRRSVLRRGAVLGGAMVWTVPAVQTIAGPAFAAGSPPCCAKVATNVNGVCELLTFKEDADCCTCIGEASGVPLAIAVIGCAITGRCDLESTTADCTAACP